MADEVDVLRRKVALSCRILAMCGLVKETTGHVSARIPGTNELVVRGRRRDETGLLFTRAEDVLRTDFDGHGDELQAGLSTPAEFPIHGEIYKARAEAACVVHAHPPSILLCGIAGVDLRPIFGAYDPSAMMFGAEGVPVFPRAITLTRPELVWPMLEVMGEKNFCLMRGHGITVYGASVEEATVRAIKFETLARVTWEATSRGPIPDISAEDLEILAGRLGGPRERGSNAVWRYYVQLLGHEKLRLEDPLPPAD